jgi:predicted  nucleic acid-binding Zn-ribbon protein
MNHASSRRTSALLVAAACVAPLLAAAGTGPATAGPVASAVFRVNTSINNYQADGRTAMDADGDYIVTWESLQNDFSFDIYAQRYNSAGVAQGSETRINTTTVGDQHLPAVAMDTDGDYVITWESPDGSGSGVYFQRYNAAGVPQGTETRVNTTTTDVQIRPEVAMDADGDYVITWTSHAQDGSIYGIYAQRYSANGNPQGVETRVNTTTADNQESSTIAMDADGNYVITWQSNLQDDGSSIGVFAQRYSAAGTPRGPETQVNTTTASQQQYPNVAMDVDGDYIITWDSVGQDGSGLGVYAQRYNANGTPQGTETRINTTTADDQINGIAAFDARGDYVIAWTSHLQDGSGYGVYARRYSSEGTAESAESRINTFTSNDQLFTSVAMDADGDYVITWMSYLQEDGESYEIYGRRLRGPEPVDLSLSQSESADPVAVGRRVTYRMQVANLGEPATDTGVAAIDAAIGTATGVRVVSTVPEGATFVSSAGTGWTCTPFAATTRCLLTGPLAAGDVAPTLALTYTAPDTAGPLLHHARVYENQRDPVPANDAETERTSVMCSLEFNAPSFSQTEASAMTATVTRHGTGCGTSGVSYTTAAASATAGTDFTNVAGTLTWTDADTDLAFSIPLVDDGLDEKTEQLNLLLTNPTGALLATRSLANGLIGDNDDPPRINFTSTAATAAEPGALLDLTVQLSEVSGQDVTVVLAKAGTATYLTDYFAPKRLTIPAGQRNVTFTVEVADDNTVEGNELAVIALATPTAATLGTQKTYRLTITDDD